MSEWISVKDRLPEKFNLVIAFRSRTKQFIFAEYTGSAWCMSGTILAKHAISHWMSLPESPMKEE